MNKVILTGRLVREPEVRYSQSAESIAIARYSLAVNRRNTAKEGEPTADFIDIVALGKNGEFAEKYLHKGTKVLVIGHIQTGSYTNKDGVKVYTTDVIAEEQEFAESKSSNSNNRPATENDGFVNIPEGIDEDLPFAQPTR